MSYCFVEQKAGFNPDKAELLRIAYLNEKASERIDYSKVVFPFEDMKLFKRYLSPKRRILDVGCGIGQYTSDLSVLPYDYIGIDVPTKQLQVAEALHPDAHFISRSYRRLRFYPGAFDGIWCCKTFCHEPKHNMLNVFKGLREVLETGGIMMVIMPFSYYSHEKLEHNLRGKPLYWYAEYHLSELISLLIQAGFSVVESHTRGAPDNTVSVLARNSVSLLEKHMSF